MLGNGYQTGAAARREKNRAEMENAILEIAHAMVAENGADALTIRGIARQLEYSPAAIYEYFESREDILKTLFFQGSGGLSETMEKAIRDLGDDVDPIHALIKVAGEYRKMALSNPEMYRLVLGSGRFPHDDVVERDDEGLPVSMGYLVHMIRDGIEQGLMIPQDPLNTAIATWAVVHGYVSLELSSHLENMICTLRPDLAETRDETKADLFEQCVRAMLTGILTDAGRAHINS